MNEFVMADINNEFTFGLLLMSLSAHGPVAVILSVPVAVVMIAAAYRLVRRR